MGNTLVQYWCNEVYKDHPHIHGEYSDRPSTQCHLAGSPPHTWGILLQLRILESNQWITPTYMGNTKQLKSRKKSKKDHPHIHGEYFQNIATQENVGGSPPHTWGIQGGMAFWDLGYRITPTYMGNTIVVNGDDKDN